jgi:hypothetical protein
MKAKDFIIIGGAIALYYLYQKNKTKTSSTSTAESEAQEEATPSGGGGGGGSMPSGASSMPSTPKPPTPKPSTPILGTIIGGTTLGGEAIFTGNTPVSTISSADTPIRNITNPISTTLVPAIVPPPTQTPEESLLSGGIRPIVKPTRTLSTEII